LVASQSVVQYNQIGIISIFVVSSIGSCFVGLGSILVINKGIGQVLAFNSLQVNVVGLIGLVIGN